MAYLDQYGAATQGELRVLLNPDGWAHRFAMRALAYRTSS